MATITEERVGRPRVRFNESANIIRNIGTNNYKEEDNSILPFSTTIKSSFVGKEKTVLPQFNARHPDLHPTKQHKTNIMSSPLDKPPPMDLRHLLMEIRYDLAKAKGLHASFNNGLANIITPIPYPDDTPSQLSASEATFASNKTPQLSSGSEPSNLANAHTCQCGASKTKETPVADAASAAVESATDPHVQIDTILAAAATDADSSDLISIDSESLLSKQSDSMSPVDTDASSIDSNPGVPASKEEDSLHVTFKELSTNTERYSDEAGINKRGVGTAAAGTDIDEKEGKELKRKPSLRKQLEYKTRGVLHKITERIHKP